MSFAVELAIGTFMIGTSVAVHAVALDFIIRASKRLEQVLRRSLKRLWKSALSGVVVCCIFFVHVTLIWLWALLYTVLHCSPLHGFSDALYFSTVVYSTLGFGDIILDESCRMLSGIEGAAGFILFSWTAAFIFEIVGQIYRKEAGAL